MDQQQLELMWQYQQEDIKADRIANEIKRSPTRQKLEKSRDFIMEQQKKYKQIEEQVAVMADRKDAIRDAIARCEEQIAALTARFEQSAYAAMEGEIPSQRIGDMVMEELKAINDVAYVRFAAVYRKFTDLGTFMDELQKLVNESKHQPE